MDRLREELCDKKITIVGNAPCALHTNYGTLIDNSDMVIRFNNYKTAGFEKAVGSKTTHWVINCAGIKKCIKYHKISQNDNKSKCNNCSIDPL